MCYDFLKRKIKFYLICVRAFFMCEKFLSPSQKRKWLAVRYHQQALRFCVFVEGVLLALRAMDSRLRGNDEWGKCEWASEPSAIEDAHRFGQ